ncbi:M56 family metallopeptidase [Paenibacillus sp. M1]|uniref:M56 family metallopeptidase n=1 Tax=Paenibacillus haidiansis TaxID=1574488 RepID=A0ABU7VM04_9BACL
MWEKRSGWMLGAVFLTAGFVYVQMTLFLLQFVLHVRIPVNLFNFCFEILRFIGFPVRMNVMLFLLGSSLVCSMVALLREGLAAYRFRRAERLLADKEVTQAACEEHGLDRKRFTVIEHRDSIAMTIGLARPRIVLSTGLIGELSDRELHAVIAHEKYHLRRRHPLAIFLLSLVGIAFWYIPIYRWFIGKYKMLIELRADRHAIDATGGVTDLGSALLVMLKRGQPSPTALSSVSFAENAINLRLKLLLDPHFKPSFRPPLIPCLVSVFAFFFIVF